MPDRASFRASQDRASDRPASPFDAQPAGHAGAGRQPARSVRPAAVTRIGIVTASATAPAMLMQLLDALRRERGVELIGLIGATAASAVPPSPPPRPTPAARAIALCAHALGAAERGLLNGVGLFVRSVAKRLSGTVGLGGRYATASGPIAFDRTIDLGQARAAALPRFDLLLTLDEALPAAVAAIAGEAEIIRLRLGSTAPRALHLAGFAEVYRGADRTPVGLERIDPETGAGRWLYRGHNRTMPLFYLNQAAIWDRAASLLRCHLAQRRAGVGPAASGAAASGAAASGAAADSLPAAADAARPAAVDAARPAPTAAEAVATPGLPALLAYPLRVGGRVGRLAVRQWQGKRRWSVAIHRRGAGPGSIGEPTPIEPAPSGHFHADPILYRCPRTGAGYCFVEEFDPLLGHARIAVLEQGAQGWRRLGIALTEPFHLSFPFLFEYEGGLYMCPETYEADVILAYRCVDFPLGWRRCRELMTDVSAADTMLFPRDGRWWMLTNLDRAGNPNHQSELHVFYADSPLSAEWTPIAGNPVRIDPNGGRNGGLAIRDGRIFRYGQIQSFEAYGQGLNRYEIERLDPGGYRETLVERVQPPPGSSGLHTFAEIDDLVAFDLLGAPRIASR